MMYNRASGVKYDEAAIEAWTRLTPEQRDWRAEAFAPHVSEATTRHGGKATPTEIIEGLSEAGRAAMSQLSTDPYTALLIFKAEMDTRIGVLRGYGKPGNGPLPGLGGSPVSAPAKQVTPASVAMARTLSDPKGLTDALFAAEAIRKDPEVAKSKGSLAKDGKHAINITPETEAALAKVNPDPATAIAMSLAASDHLEGRPFGSGMKMIGLDDKIDIEELTRQNGGRPPRFVVTRRDDVQQADWRKNEEAFLTALGPVVARDDEAMRGKPLPPGVETVPIDSIEVPPRGSRPRLPPFDEKAINVSLPTLLAQAEPELTSLIRRAKMFKFDKHSEKLVTSLMETDWREWLGQALIPFPTTFIESGVQWVQWKADDDNEPVMAVGSKGVLIHGRVIVPCFRIAEVAASLTTRAMMVPAALMDEPGDRVFSPEESALIKACRPDYPDLIKVWGADYVAKYDPIDGTTFPGGELVVSGHETSARRLMRLADHWSDVGMFGMVMQDSILRWALAALAVINAQRDVIEVEARASNHDGRTWVGTKHIPKYTPSLIRLKPEAPRVEYVEPVTGERPEPDPNREIIRKREHDVRAHYITKDYKPNDEWEEFTNSKGETRYRRIRKAHKRGDAELGVVDSQYVVGEHAEPTRDQPAEATHERPVFSDAGSAASPGGETFPQDSQASAGGPTRHSGGIRLWARNATRYVKQLFGRNTKVRVRDNETEAD